MSHRGGATTMARSTRRTSSWPRFAGWAHSTPSYAGEPERNGIMERWMRTLKEECLDLHDLESLEHAREVIGKCIRDYNERWWPERHGQRTPAEVRAQLRRVA